MNINHRTAVRAGMLACLWLGLAGVRADLSNARPNTLTESESAAGWRLLWDGKTTKGWRGVKTETFPSRKWEVKDGVLTVRAARTPLSGRGPSRQLPGGGKRESVLPSYCCKTASIFGT